MLEHVEYAHLQFWQLPDDDFKLIVTGLRDVEDERCAQCGPRFGQQCDQHRCHAIRANGSRCKGRVGRDRTDFCHTHGCGELISFDPLPVVCSAPVVWVDVPGEGRYGSRCRAHCSPFGDIVIPNFTYPTNNTREN